MAERPPFVWIKPDTHGSFTRVQLRDVLDVADLADAAALRLNMSATSELFLVALPSLEPPLPAAILAALHGDPLRVTAELAGIGVLPGCWMVMRVSTDALTQERQARLAAEDALIREREARLAAQALFEKEKFMALMLSISSAGSGDTASHADEGRRGAPLPETVPLEAVLGSLPTAPSSQETLQAWKNFASAHVLLNQPLRSKLDENRDVHPTIGVLLGAALGRDLRLWSNALAEDDVAVAKVRPDFTITHARDAMPSTIGALLLVEVKLPGDLIAACAQARIYLRRSIHKRCTEADARGEGMERIFAYALATDGRSVVALKMRSGAPPPGTSFEGATPCPVVQSEALPLLNWNFLGKPPAWGRQHPTDGFAALHRLCTAPPASLAAEAILTQLWVQLEYQPGEGGGGGGGGGGGEQLGGGGGSASVPLVLDVRLGCGGSSDVYTCSAELGVAAAVPARASLAAKVSRFATALVQKCFAQECAALLKLRDAAAQGLVPTLVATGVRQGGAASWPLLLLHPCGQSLPSWVAECVKADLQGGGGGGGDGGGGGGQDRVFAARSACASTVALRLLDALKAAHAVSLVHCDVRPSNIVVIRGAGAMLVDWGISRIIGNDAQGCGVAAYADKRVFTQDSYQARPVQDVIGLLLTWLCVAHSELCDAPWCTTGAWETMFAARKAWMVQRSRENVVVKRVVEALDVAEAKWSWAGSEEALYNLAREALTGGV